MASALRKPPAILTQLLRAAHQRTSTASSQRTLHTITNTNRATSSRVPPPPFTTISPAQHQWRTGFHSSSKLQGKPRTMGQIKARNSTGPFSWKAAALFVVTGAAMIIYFRVEKERLARKRVAEMNKGVGKPKVGGPFVLTDLEGKTVTEEELKGRYSFVYFGFTHCPDICPDELDKMAAIIDNVKAQTKGENVFLPVFITCDPARDTPEVLKNYLKEFHDDIIGLTGTYEQVRNVCKQYRVYFSTPRDVQPGEDYLVDHSIYFYLMDPEGDFVECIGRQDTPESATKVIMEHINDWKREGKPLKK
ncbi:SCO1 protein [Aspergillus taichungensis]|uniref:SCO1 protein n=1 Tax=Aspergillus taichungensis TaxID=482145 RepID=A0A2J5HYU6_9EURO|nr:SCO1 protein [Aspergillus taichungensis]